MISVRRHCFCVWSFAIKDKGFSDLEVWLRFKDRISAEHRTQPTAARTALPTSKPGGWSAASCAYAVFAARFLSDCRLAERLDSDNRSFF